MLNIPTLTTSIPDIDAAFRIALGDFLGNIVNYQGGLNRRPRPSVIAGLDYVTPWTRDASFNVWYAGGLIAPEAARNTLLAVVEKIDGKERIGGEYWDAIIWAFGAWQYYLYTGDAKLLSLAHRAVENSLKFFESTELDETDGLFRGGACFQDGIAGYPDKFVSRSLGSGIMNCLEDHPDYLAKRGVGLPMKALSTNSLYLIAYRTAAAMRQELGLNVDPALAERADKLKQAINDRFFDAQGGNYRYLVDADDPLTLRQEGLGAAFVVISGAADVERRELVFKNQHITPHGIPCVWPQFDRYALSPGSYGRHCGLIWPQVNAAWSYALAKYGHPERAFEELELLAAKAARDTMFYEIYHPETGLPYGGLQEDREVGRIREWASCRRQTWCAAGYINMVLTTLIGMRFDTDGLRLKPYLPAECDRISIRDLNYRQAILDITVERGKAPGISCNGQPVDHIPVNAAGRLDVRISIA